MEETKKEKYQFELRELNGGRRAGIAMRSIASHQCSPGLIPMLGVKCVLSLLVVRFVLREITMAHKGQIKVSPVSSPKPAKETRRARETSEFPA